MLDDYRAAGKGNGRGEIKVVPSASYLDYNLYWFKKHDLIVLRLSPKGSR